MVADQEAVLIVSSPGPAIPSPERAYRLPDARAQVASNWARSMELRLQTERVLAETQAIQRAIADARRERRSSREGRERLQHSEYARLLARLDTMPVIEQAKGIIMAQSRCAAAEAFDRLRRASQHTNVPVRDLAAQLVATAAGGSARANPPPQGRTHRALNRAG
jgi:ANTAR domain